MARVPVGSNARALHTAVGQPEERKAGVAWVVEDGRDLAGAVWTHETHPFPPAIHLAKPFDSLLRVANAAHLDAPVPPLRLRAPDLPPLRHCHDVVGSEHLQFLNLAAPGRFLKVHDRSVVGGSLPTAQAQHLSN